MQESESSEEEDALLSRVLLHVTAHAAPQGVTQETAESPDPQRVRQKKRGRPAAASHKPSAGTGELRTLCYFLEFAVPDTRRLARAGYGSNRAMLCLRSQQRAC